MSYKIIKSVYERLKIVGLKAGHPSETVLVEGRNGEKLYNIKYLPHEISSAGFEFKSDENASLLVFPEDKKYDTDGFLVEDFDKIKVIMRGVFEPQYAVTKNRQGTKLLNEIPNVRKTPIKRISEESNTRKGSVKPSGEVLVEYITDLFKARKRLKMTDVIDGFKTDYGLAKAGKAKTDKKRKIWENVMLLEQRGIIKPDGEEFVYVE